MKNNNISFSEAFRMQNRAVGLLRKERPGWYLSVWTCTAITALTPYVNIYFSAQIIGELAGQRDPQRLLTLVLITVFSNASFALLTAALKRWMTRMREPICFSIHKLLTDKMMDMDFCRLDDPQTYDRLSQINQNMNWSGWGLARVDEYTSTLLEALLGILGVIVLTFSLFAQRIPVEASELAFLDHPLVLLGVIALLLLSIWLSTHCINKAEKLWADQSFSARMGNRFFGFFGFMAFTERDRAADIRMYNQQDICRNYSDKCTSFSSNGPLARLARGQIGFLSAISSILSVIFTGMVYTFVCLKSIAGAFGVGSVTQYIAALTGLSKNLSSLLKAIGGIKNNAPFLKETFEHLDIPHEMYQGSLTTEKRNDCQYEIEFRDVSFRYPGTETWALRHLSMKFRVGENLAVVGQNGSGKTTFIKLLCRLYDPTEGQILLNGIDIRKYNYREYMDLFSVVFQDYQLLAFALGQNVAAAEQYDKQHVEKVLTQAGFLGRLGKMPFGTETCLYKEFEESGVEISGGEAQKIAIARALYKDAPFIILDEPTAALDPITEAEIYEKFNDMVGGKTAIYISHRLSSCKFCDEIIVFDSGTVVQQGTHKDLVADKDGKYYALWNAQAQYYI